MATKNKTQVVEDAHDLRCTLSAGAVDDIGVIRGATVAKANVVALGKFVLLDKAGAITRDPKQGVKKLPIYTDEKTLTTLMGAVQDVGGKLKVREDHDDSIGARAGFADAFALAANGTVTADIHLFDSYRNRSVVIETANKTPDKIGLSIDFVPQYELVGDKALMRIASIEAVDIVDAGAITPDGMFLSAGVDSAARLQARKNSQPDLTMTPEEIMSAVTKAVAPFAAAVEECKAALAKLTVTPQAPAADGAMKAEIEALKLSVANADKLAKDATAATAQLKKDRALLGFRGTVADKASLASKTAEEIEQLNATAKDYLTLVAERAESAKCSRTDAHIYVQRNNRDVYAAHLKAKGVYDPSRDKMAATRAA